MALTPYHTKYFAHDLTRRATGGMERLPMSLFECGGQGVHWLLGYLISSPLLGAPSRHARAGQRISDCDLGDVGLGYEAVHIGLVKLARGATQHVQHGDDVALRTHRGVDYCVYAHARDGASVGAAREVHCIVRDNLRLAG